MSATPILAVTNDETFLALLRSKLRDQLGQKGRIAAAPSRRRSMSALEDSASPAYRGSPGGRQRAVRAARPLLWATSVLSRPTPVVVIAERYLIDQATMMYRMGVSEYISRTHHLDQLGEVLGAYLRPVTTAGGRAQRLTAAAARWAHRIMRPLR